MLIRKRRYKTGFTLAEVLVTLAIIGVVASLTIPTLIKNNEKQQWIVKYKQAFNIVNEATRMIRAENGGTLLNAWGGHLDHESMYNAYKPFLRTAKLCENQVAAGNCFAASYSSLKGDVLSSSAMYSVILSNGVSLSFFSLGSNLMNQQNSIMVDINGKKGPNVMGKDYHKFNVFINSDPVKPYCSGDPNGLIILGCSSDLKTNWGDSCGVRILRGDYAEDY